MSSTKVLTEKQKEAIEIQRRFREKVEIIVGPKKEKKIVTDLPEPSFKEWRIKVKGQSGIGNVLVRKVLYGKSRSTVKPKLPSSQKWSIFCDCRERGEFGLTCDHKYHIATGELMKILGWTDELTEFIKILNSEDYINFRKMNDDLNPKWYIDIKSYPSKIRMQQLAKYNFGNNFSSLKDVELYIKYKYFQFYKSRNKEVLNIENKEQINSDDIFKNLRKIVENTDIGIMRFQQNDRFSMLESKMNVLNGLLENDTSNERDLMEQIGLSFHNFGGDKCLYYQ